MKRAVFIILFACLGLSGEANVVRHSYDLTATVSYTYYSLGKPKTVTTGGAAFSMDYYYRNPHDFAYLWFGLGFL